MLHRIPEKNYQTAPFSPEQTPTYMSVQSKHSNTHEYGNEYRTHHNVFGHAILPMAVLYALVILVNTVTVWVATGSLASLFFLGLGTVLVLMPLPLYLLNLRRTGFFYFTYLYYAVTVYLFFVGGGDTYVHFVLLMLPPFAYLNRNQQIEQIYLWVGAGILFLFCHFMRGNFEPLATYPKTSWLSYFNGGGIVLSGYYLFYLMRKDLQSYTRALVRSRDHYQSVMDGAMDAIVSVDARHRIIGWNPQAERIFGFTKEDILGQFWYDMLIPERYQDKFRGMFQQFKMSGDTPYFHDRQEVLLQRKNGSTFLSESSISPINLSGNLIYHAFVRDITDRDNIRRKLLATNAELQQFASVASHDMKEPLRTIANFSGLLRRRIQHDTEGVELLAFVEDAAKRMTKLLEDLIRYARSGNPTVELYPVDLGKVCQGVEKNLLHLLVRNNGQLNCSNLPTLLGTETLYVQLLQNLVSNAIKYQLAGNPPIVDVSGTRVRGGYNLCVTDNGIGMSQEQITQIFQPFRRLHSRLDYEGSGIGLATCKKIVDSLDGAIEVISTPGAGSTFTIFLPEKLVVDEALVKTDAVAV